MKTMILITMTIIVIMVLLIAWLMYHQLSMERQLRKLNELRATELSHIAENLARHSEKLDLLQEIALKAPEEKKPEEMTIEEQLEEARNKVFGEWIGNIVNYDPYKVNE